MTESESTSPTMTPEVTVQRSERQSIGFTQEFSRRDLREARAVRDLFTQGVDRIVQQTGRPPRSLVVGVDVLRGLEHAFFPSQDLRQVGELTILGVRVVVDYNTPPGTAYFVGDTYVPQPLQMNYQALEPRIMGQWVDENPYVDHAQAMHSAVAARDLESVRRAQEAMAQRQHEDIRRYMETRTYTHSEMAERYPREEIDRHRQAFEEHRRAQAQRDPEQDPEFIAECRRIENLPRPEGSSLGEPRTPSRRGRGRSHNFSTRPTETPSESISVETIGEASLARVIAQLSQSVEPGVREIRWDVIDGWQD